MTRVTHTGLTLGPVTLGGGAGAGVLYVWGPFDFPVDYAAGAIPSPYTESGALGAITITDTGNSLSIASGALNATQAAVSGGDPRLLSNAIAYAPGLIIQFDHEFTGAPFSGAGVQTVAAYAPNRGLFHSATYAFEDSTLGAANTGTRTRHSVVIAGSASAYIFLDGVLAWVANTPGTGDLYAFVNARVAGAVRFINKLYYARGFVSANPLFNANYAICSINVASPVSGTSYTATADAITDLTLTAPNPLADSAGYRYRYTDDDNCWHSYFNSAGAYRLDSVAASVATNRINVAAVIAAANARTMRTISNGSLHNAYTLSTTWTKRGSQINVSHLNTNTAIRPYVTGSWTMSNLRSYPTTDPRYGAELNKT